MIPFQQIWWVYINSRAKNLFLPHAISSICHMFGFRFVLYALIWCHWYGILKCIKIISFLSVVFHFSVFLHSKRRRPHSSNYVMILYMCAYRINMSSLEWNAIHYDCGYDYGMLSFISNSTFLKKNSIIEVVY